MNTIYLTEHFNGNIIPMRKETCKERLLSTWLEELNLCIDIKDIPKLGVTYLKYKKKEIDASRNGFPLDSSFSQSMYSLMTRYRKRSVPNRVPDGFGNLKSDLKDKETLTEKIGGKRKIKKNKVKLSKTKKSIKKG